jgi:hypothetical protein
LRFNIEKLKKPCLPYIDPGLPMEEDFSQYDPQKTRMNMVAAAAIGAQGIKFWPGEIGLDAEYLRMICVTANEIATYEDFYVAGEKIGGIAVTATDASNSTNAASSIRHTSHKLGDKLLVTIFNYHEFEEKTCEINLPGFERRRVTIPPENISFNLFVYSNGK